MELEYHVVSIGALSRNRLWNEMDARRTSHATTTLIREGTTTILVDPSLPPEVLQQRLDERTGLRPDQVDIVFLTCFRPVHRRSLGLFDRATWLIHELEKAAYEAHLQEMADRLRAGDRDLEALVRNEQAMLKRCRLADDRLSPQVHLFPLAGVTPGNAGLLLASASRTTVLTGDAVLTRGHFEAGRVFEQASDVEQARESLREVMEVADEVVPGHDNAFRVFGR